MKLIKRNTITLSLLIFILVLTGCSKKEKSDKLLNEEVVDNAEVIEMENEESDIKRGNEDLKYPSIDHRLSIIKDEKFKDALSRNRAILDDDSEYDIETGDTIDCNKVEKRENISFSYKSEKRENRVTEYKDKEYHYYKKEGISNEDLIANHPMFTIDKRAKEPKLNHPQEDEKQVFRFMDVYKEMEDEKGNPYRRVVYSLSINSNFNDDTETYNISATVEDIDRKEKGLQLRGTKSIIVDSSTGITVDPVSMGMDEDEEKRKINSEEMIYVSPERLFNGIYLEDGRLDVSELTSMLLNAKGLSEGSCVENIIEKNIPNLLDMFVFLGVFSDEAEIIDYSIYTNTIHVVVNDNGNKYIISYRV